MQLCKHVNRLDLKVMLTRVYLKIIPLIKSLNSIKGTRFFKI